MLTKDEFLNQKRDYSEFLVHLTRSTDNISAIQVLLQILTAGKIEARGAYSLFMYSLDPLPPEVQAAFDVACFSECPLAFVRDIVAEVKREKPLEPYGVFVTKDALVEAGGNPVLYLSGTAIDAAWETWKVLVREERWDIVGGLMPFVSKFDDDIDFHWEREWRVPGGLDISPDVVQFIVCPEKAIHTLQEALERAELYEWLTVPVVDATWSPERMVDEVALNAMRW